MAPRRPVIAIVGPTGTGKTVLGIAIASHLNTEVISVDSLQCYKHGHIMTAAPTAAEMKHVKHHMVDYLPPDAEPGPGFVQRAVNVANNLHTKGKIPILVGGSTSLMLPILLAPRGNNLGTTVEEGLNDHEGKDCGRLRWRTLVIMLKGKDEESLGKRQDARVEEMLAMGLVRELKELYLLQKELNLEKYGTKSRLDDEEVGKRGVWKCIGYKELYPFLVATDNRAMRTSSSNTQPDHGLHRPYVNSNGLMEEVTEVQGEEGETLLREGIQMMKETTRWYAQWQTTWSETVLVPKLRTEGMPVHRIEVPSAIGTCNENRHGEREQKRDGDFKKRWVESVEGPAMRLCEAWRAAVNWLDDHAGTGIGVAVGGVMMKESNNSVLQGRKNKGNTIGILSPIIMVRSSTAG
ncbi:unnamed protein product [Calypogeia fissa]